MKFRLSFLLTAALLAPSLTPPHVPAQKPGDSKVIAMVPDPGFPEALAGAGLRPIGVNGIRIDKYNASVYVSVTSSSIGGVIYRLPLVANPVGTDLELFASLGNNEMNTGPDGIAFGKSGNLYVAEALTSTIKVFNPDGTVDAVYAGPALSPLGLPVPWANPANIAFDDKNRTLLVTNHAILVDDPVFMVFDVFVNDKGSPLP